MFEATQSQVNTFRKIIDSLKDLVIEVNLEATHNGNKYLNLYFYIFIFIIKF